MDGFCALDSHLSMAWNCQQLSDLEKLYYDAFALIEWELDTLSVPVLSNHTDHVSVCYLCNQIHVKCFHFETTDKQAILSIDHTSFYTAKDKSKLS